MRHFSRFALFLASLIVLAACSDPQPPIGQWEGAYEDQGLMIVARLQIDGSGHVRVSAPNAITDTAPLSDDDRAALRAKLESGLAASWPSVAPLPLEFDGHAFHKPGGVAPQLEWDKAAKRMTLIFYSGNRRSVRVPLDAVADFQANS
ncbi:MAG TPA: hypothetical protein VNH44_19125 [Micropepsaceae bacterium]|nr:hypothetical protein [Micropepsaceae bacterium]